MPIKIIKEKNIFSLMGKKSEYIFALNNEGLLKHIYWGEKLNCLDEIEAGVTFAISSNDTVDDMTPEEFSYFGGLRNKETSLKINFSDGTRDLSMKFNGSSIEKNILKLELIDTHYPLKVDLFYKIYDELDIIERWIEVSNTGKESITIESIASAEFNFDEEGFSHTNVYGHWISEQKLFTEKLSPGKKILESRKGNTGHNHNPYFILHKNATETSGDVYFGVLAHSGNFKTTFEVTPYGTTHILIGINNHDFSSKLSGGETLSTPSVYCGHESNGFTGMSHRLHDLCKNHLCPKTHNDKIHPVLYNSWEATYFDFNCDKQIELAHKAADLGVELFVIDDGWFGSRNSDNAGLGDWFVNESKFPNGLKPIIEEVNKLGMDFGIWVEPEMVNPDSELFRKHPDWIYQFKNRKSTESRNQYVLNLCNPEVVKYLKDILSKLLGENNIKYLKWDFNRPFSEPGALNLPLENQKFIWYQHTLSLYEIVDELKNKFPHVAIEACASGGGRIDYGCIKHFDQFWTSDNTDAPDRLTIQEGYSMIYPANTMRAWVTDCPNFTNKHKIPLKYRFHCAMMGTLGIGGNLNNWSENEIDEAKGYIEQYKKLRDIIQYGKQYRISSIDFGIASVQYVLKNKSVLFIFNRTEKFGKEMIPIKFRGLEKSKKYKISIDGFEIEKSGNFLMKIGLLIHLPGDYASKMISLNC